MGSSSASCLVHLFCASLAIPGPMATTGRRNTVANKTRKTQNYFIFSVDIQLFSYAKTKAYHHSSSTEALRSRFLFRGLQLWIKKWTTWIINILTVEGGPVANHIENRVCTTQLDQKTCTALILKATFNNTKGQIYHETAAPSVWT